MPGGMGIGPWGHCPWTSRRHGYSFPPEGGCHPGFVTAPGKEIPGPIFPGATSTAWRMGSNLDNGLRVC